MIRLHRHRFLHPAAETPAWAATVDRWYQLDAYAFGLADATYRWRAQAQMPELVLLASESASNDTDAKFARTGAISPAKFVHTLPNVRVSSLCLVLEWSGPVLCIQNDPRTVTSALREAEGFPGCRWVTGVRRLAEGSYEAYCFEFPEEAEQSPWGRFVDDKELWQELDGGRNA